MHLRNITVNCTKYNIILIYLDVGVKYEPDLFLTGESNSPGLSSSALVLLLSMCSQRELDPAHTRPVAQSPCAAVLCRLM